MPPTQMTLLDLESEKERLLLEIEVAQRKEQLRVLSENSGYLSEAFQDLVDPREYLTDTPGSGLSGSLKTTTLDDRLHGTNRPFFETEEDLNQIRGLARYLTSTDEISIGIMETLSNYVIGTGYIYAVAGEDEEVVLQVQAFLDDFMKTNKWAERERELFRRDRRDGEFFLRFHHIGSGLTRLRIIEPEYIKEPMDARSIEDFMNNPGLDWSFGIATAPGDVEAVLGYNIMWDPRSNDEEFVSVDDLYHHKINTDCTVKRGLSDWYAVDREVQGAAKLLGNMVDGASLQAAIPWIEEFAAGMDKSQISALDAGKIEATFQRKLSAGGSRTVNVRRYEPNSVLRVENGRKYHPGPMGSARNPNFIQAQQAALRNVGVRWSMPEFMVSGDSSSANYSSVLVAETPFVKSAEVKQAGYVAVFKDILWKAIDTGIRFGGLEVGMDTRELQQAIAIKAETPQVAIRNRPAETQIRQSLWSAGILSKKTWAALEGLNLDEEELNGAEERGTEQPVAQAVLQGALNQ